MKHFWKLRGIMFQSKKSAADGGWTMLEEEGGGKYYVRKKITARRKMRMLRKEFTNLDFKFVAIP